MTDQGIVVLGIPIPSSSPIFLSIIAIHVAAGLSCTVAGRTVRRRQRPGWLPLHVTGMAIAYILLLTAFYVDNGPHLPLWRSLPPLAHWLLPSLVGVPILVWVRRYHPLLGRVHAVPSRDAT